MNTKPLTLTEVSKLLEELPTDEAIENEQIQSFIDNITNAGKEILRQREDYGEYCNDASTFILSATIAELIQSGDPKQYMIAMTMLKNPNIFTPIFGYAFIYSVGLCAIEELR